MLKIPWYNEAWFLFQTGEKTNNINTSEVLHT